MLLGLKWIHMLVLIKVEPDGYHLNLLCKRHPPDVMAEYQPQTM